MSKGGDVVNISLLLGKSPRRAAVGLPYVSRIIVLPYADFPQASEITIMITPLTLDTQRTPTATHIFKRSKTQDQVSRVVACLS